MLKSLSEIPEIEFPVIKEESGLMANKEKKIISNNLLKIREELNYTQQELGQILDVSERMICYYETGLSSLPIDKAVLIRKKWNYSLGWIYNQDLSGKFHDVKMCIRDRL